MAVELAQFPDGCGGCGGSCCKEASFGGAPWSRDELDRLDSIIGSVAASAERAYMAENFRPSSEGVPALIPCHHLTETGTCGIEQSKPSVCRAYGVGSQECRDVRHKYGVAEWQH